MAARNMTRPGQATTSDGDPLSPDRLGERVGGVDADEHEDEQEEHHHRAGVDEDLDDAEELRLRGEVEHAEVDHDEGHAQRGVDRLAGEEQPEGPQDHERCDDPEQDQASA
jgi:hypothetical protein